MKTATIDDVMSWEPCEEYTKKKVTKLFAGRESMSALDMLELDIPTYDKFWAVLREELIDASILHEFACRCDERALSRLENPDPRSTAAIEAKRAWIKGEITDEELYAAWGAVRDAERKWQVDMLIEMLRGQEHENSNN